MRWVYILQCEDGYYYVGETSRLFRRFWEHDKGSGGINTSTFIPISIVALYSVERLGKFFDYAIKVDNNDFRLNHNIYYNRGGIIEEFNNDGEEYSNLYAENQITEKLMISNEMTWEKIRGGKYTRFDCTYKFPKNDLVKKLPNCSCGLPCDIRQNDKDKSLYFRCAKKNMWDEMREEFEITDEPCKFFLKFEDTKYRTEYEKRKQNVKSLTSKSYWLRTLSGIHAEHCIGGCGKEYDWNNTVRHLGKSINLCFDCFIDKNEELENKYKLTMGFSDGL